MFIENDNIKICYEKRGNSHNPALVLIMGITGQLISWPEPFLELLVQAGFFVIIYDHRDVGLSSYYDGLPTPSIDQALQQLQQGKLPVVPYTFHDMAADICLLLDGLSIKKAHICGSSMGGQIAQVFALNYPERVLSLTLMITSSGDQDLPPPQQQVLDFFFSEAPKENDIPAAINRHIEQYKIYNHANDYCLTEAAAGYELAYQRAYHPQGNQRHLLAMLTAMPRSELLQKLKIPALIVQGDYDPVFSVEHGERLHQVLTNSELLVIKNMGHGLPERAWQKIIEKMIMLQSGVAK